MKNINLVLSVCGSVFIRCLFLFYLSISAVYAMSPLPGGGGGSGGQGGAGSWATESIGGMSVRIYTPPESNLMLDGQRALMINLHGCAQSAGDLANNGNWTSTADDYGMIVAIPDAPNGGVIAGCWDYYGSSHSRNNKHNDNLITLANTLKNRASLNIDPDQVYISGLSSGASEAMVMGCLAPDIFAGVGINAGPTIGTSSFQIGSVSTSENSAVSLCNNFAGGNSSHFATQLTSVIYGTSDFTVAQGYGDLNADVMSNIYNANSTASLNMNSLEGNNTSGSGTIWSDSQGPRVTLIRNSGLGHAWPAGSGSGGNYVSANTVDYPAHLADFFFANNRRVSGGGSGDGGSGDGGSGDGGSGDGGSGDGGSGDGGSGDGGSGDGGSGWVCTQTTASNYSHVSAGRAYQNFGSTFAVGSNDAMGLWNIFVTTTLAQTAAGYYEVGNCP